MATSKQGYTITFARSARKELESLDHTIALRIFTIIKELPLDPQPAGCKKLTGQNSLLPLFSLQVLVFSFLVIKFRFPNAWFHLKKMNIH